MTRPIYIYLTPFFPSPESWVGGYCLDAAKALVRDGRYDVRVLVPSKGNDYEWDGIKVYRFKQIVAPCGIAPFIFSRRNFKHLLRKLAEIGVSANDVSVFHANTLFCGFYAAYFKKINLNVKAIIQFHSSYSLTLASGRLGVLPIHATYLYFYYRRILEGVDILVFVSKMACDTFGKRYIGVPEGEVRDVRSLLLLGSWMRDLRLPRKEVVYNGIDEMLFNKSGRKSHPGFVIGCVANFQPLKSQITLLKAVSILKDKIEGMKVRLIGSGVTLESCKEYVISSGLEEIVSFEKEIDHRCLPDFYRSLDLFVLPSRLEGFLCVCVESWACGTPSIFCRGISLSELVPDDEKGKWLFAPFDERDLANRVLEYREHRWDQHFMKNLEINGIWREFLDRLEDRK